MISMRCLLYYKLCAKQLHPPDFGSYKIKNSSYIRLACTPRFSDFLPALSSSLFLIRWSIRAACCTLSSVLNNCTPQILAIVRSKTHPLQDRHATPRFSSLPPALRSSVSPIRWSVRAACRTLKLHAQRWTALCPPLELHHTTLPCFSFLFRPVSESRNADAEMLIWRECNYN